MDDFRKGDIVQSLKCDNHHYGVYIGHNTVVHLNTIKEKNGLEKTMVDLDTLEDWAKDKKEISKYITNESRWNIFFKEGKPEKIAQRALVEIGHEYSSSSLDFVLYCRYGSKIINSLKAITILIAVVIVAAAIAFFVTNVEIQKKAKVSIEENNFMIIALFHVTCSFCFAISYMTYMSNETFVWNRYVNTMLKMINRFQKPDYLWGNNDCGSDNETDEKWFPSKEYDDQQQISISKFSKERSCSIDNLIQFESVKLKMKSASKRNFFFTNRNSYSNNRSTKLDSFGDSLNQTKFDTECLINPNHKKFISIEVFKLDHLPKEHCDEDLYNLIKLTADLTVKINAKKISHRRPPVWPNTNVPYPLNNCKESSVMRTASGFINSITIMSRNKANPYKSGSDYVFVRNSDRPCPCEQCQDLDNPSDVWMEISVQTAAHVVYDTIEAKHASCRLFFDREDSEKVIFDKLSIEYVDVERDICMMNFVTCGSLADKLRKTVEHWFNLRSKVCKNYMKRKITKLTFIVSHPHGRSKKVSLGELVKIHKVSKLNKFFNLTQLIYDVDTCPGTAGAAVICVGLRNHHLHTGKNNGKNISNVGYEFKSNVPSLFERRCLKRIC